MKMMDRALSIVVRQEDVLFPHAAIGILKDVYGGRLGIMRPATIAKKVVSLCMRNGYEPESNDVVETVNDFISS